MRRILPLTILVVTALASVSDAQVTTAPAKKKNEAAVAAEVRNPHKTFLLTTQASKDLADVIQAHWQKKQFRYERNDAAVGHEESGTEEVTYLGVATSPPAEALRKHFRLQKGVGLAVDWVDADSPAARAGLEIGDILMKVNGQILVNALQLQALIRMHKPGDAIELYLIRQGKRVTIPAELGGRTIAASDRLLSEGEGTWSVSRRRRVKVAYLGIKARRPVKGRAGLTLDWIDRNSPASRAGLQTGDILMKLDGQRLVDRAQLEALIRMHKPGEAIGLDFTRRGKPMTVLVKLAVKEVGVSDYPEAAGDLRAAQGAWWLALSGRERPPLRRTITGRFISITGPWGQTIWTWPPPELEKTLAEAEEKLAKLPPKIRKQAKAAIAESLAELGNGSAIRTSQLSVSDGQHKLTWTVTDGRKHLVVTDTDGKVIFDSLAEADGQREALDPEIRTLVEKLERSLSIEGDQIVLKTPYPGGVIKAEKVEIRMRPEDF